MAHQRQQGVFNAAWIARIRQHFGQRLGQTRATVGLAQERDATIAGHVPAGEAGADGALVYGWKVEKFRATNCSRRNGVVLLHIHPIDIGPRSPLRLFSRKFSG